MLRLLKQNLLTAVCLLSSVFLCGCLDTAKVPDTESAEQTVEAYMHEKYGIDINIRISEDSPRFGYTRVSFSTSDTGPDNVYSAYVSFDPEDKTTPIVEGEEYMRTVLDPMLTSYLNQKTGAEVSEAFNSAQIGIDSGYFNGDFPLIQTPEEVEELIRNYALSFDYCVYVNDDTSSIENSIREQLPLFSDDNVFFNIYECDPYCYSEMYMKFKKDGVIDRLLLHGKYTETTIRSFEQSTD